MLNLGLLQFGLGIDTSGLTAAQKRVEAFGRSVQGVQTAANRGFETSIGMLRRQENALLQGLEKIRAMQERINNSSLAPTVRMDMIRQLNAAYDQLSRKVTSTAKGLDPTKIDRATQSFNQAVNEIGRGFTVIDRTSKASAAAIERQTAAVFRAQEAARNLSSRIDTSRAPGLGVQGSATRVNLQQQIEQATQLFASRMNAGPVGGAQANAWRREWQAAINAVRRDFNALGGSMPRTGGLDSWLSGLQSLGASALLLQGHLGGLSTRMFALSTIVRENGLAWGIAAGALVSFIGVTRTVFQAAVQSRLVIEKLTYALTAVQGSSLLAGQSLDYVRQVSDRAGLSVESVGQSYMRLVASGKAAGMATDEVNKIFETFSMAAGTLALSAEDAQGVMRALDQIMSKGTVQAEELRGQLGDRMPGAFAIAARAMGVTTRELGKMMKAGDVLSSEFLPKFTKEVAKAFGVDSTKSIDTMQAGMQRLSNAWLFFSHSVDQAFGITNAWISLLNSLSGILNYLANNMDQVVKAAGALAGALVGLAAAMILPAVLSGVATAWSAIAAAMAVARTATVGLAAAQATLGAIIAFTPWGAIITVLARIAAVLIGAKIGFELASKAADGLNGALDNNAGIKDYIAQQKALGFQVQSTTRMMIQQAVVAARTAAIAAKAAGAELRGLKGGPDISDTLTSVGLRLHGVNVSPTQLHGSRVQVAIDKARQSVKDLKDVQEMLSGLNDVSKLPGERSIPGELGDDGKKKKGKSVDSAIDAAKRLQTAFQNAQDAMNMLFTATPPDFRAVDALMAAREQIDTMSDKELAAFAKQMGIGGASIDEVTAYLAAFIGKTNDAQDAVQEFRSVFEQLKDGMREMASNQRAFDFLAAGGDPDQMQAVDALNEAVEVISKFELLGDAGARALEGLRVQLAALGFTAETTQEALTKFFLAQKQIAEGVDALKKVNEAWKDIGEDIYRATVLTEAYAKGPAVGEWAQKLLDNAEKVDEFRKSLEAAARAGQNIDVEGQVADYAASLEALDLINERLEKNKQRMEELKQTWVDAFHTMYDNIVAVAEGTKKLGEAIVDTIMSVLDRFAQSALDTLAESSWNAIFGNPKEEAANVISGKGKLGLGKVPADQAITQMASAATLAAQALQSLSLAAGGWGTSMQGVVNAGIYPLGLQAQNTAGEFANVNPQLGAFGNGLIQILNQLSGGGGGGSIWGQLLKGAITIGTSLLGGGGLSNPGFGFADQGSLVTAPDFSSLFGRASGGPVTKGWSYKINEQGTGGGEVFVPGMSGYVGSAKDMMAGRAGDYIDMSTTIDARGATREVIAELKQEMAARDARLRAQLPVIIDNRTRDSKQRIRQ